MDDEFGFPAATRSSLKIPKEAFYKHVPLTPALKRAFVSDVETFWIKNVLTEKSLDLSVRSAIVEIDATVVFLKKREFEPKILETIARRFRDMDENKRLLFCLVFGEERLFALYYGGKLRKTERTRVGEFVPEIRGRSLDGIWESFVEQIALVDARVRKFDDLDLDAKLALQAKLADLEKKIDAANRAVAREKQPRKKFDLRERAVALAKERDALLERAG